MDTVVTASFVSGAILAPVLDFLFRILTTFKVTVSADAKLAIAVVGSILLGIVAVLTSTPDAFSEPAKLLLSIGGIFTFSQAVFKGYEKTDVRAVVAGQEVVDKANK